MDNNKLWDIIDELSKENKVLRVLSNYVEKLEQEKRQFKDEISLLRGEIGLDDCEEGIKLKQENKKLEKENKVLKKACDNLLKDCTLDQELQQSRIENKELRTKLNETISCNNYEREAREYFSHNPQGNKVSFFMFDEDYINTYDIDESMEICTIYNEDLKEYRR